MRSCTYSTLKKSNELAVLLRLLRNSVRFNNGGEAICGFAHGLFSLGADLRRDFLRCEAIEEDGHEHIAHHIYSRAAASNDPIHGKDEGYCQCDDRFRQSGGS